MEEQGTRWSLYVIIAVLILVLLCTCCCCAGIAMFWATGNSGGATPIGTPWPEWPTFEPGFSSKTTPEPVPDTPLVIEPPSDEATETLEALMQSQIPVADMHELGIRYLNVPPETSRIASTQNPDYPVGTERVFNVHNLDNDRQFTITAVLLYKTEHVYMWVEKGARVRQQDLEKAADLFENHTYPTNREFFGEEPNPGIDGDPHLSILHARGLGSNVAGYFSSTDQYVRAVRPDSNEMEMFYINLENVTIGDAFYNGVLAHEFQHMIHWYRDRNETTWLNEGCSELAMALNDRAYHRPGAYDVGGSDYAYMLRPDTQLTNWPEGSDSSAHYGAAYLFMEYFLERFGEDATKALVSHPENGMESVDLVLRDTLGLGFTHKALFADWTIANLLDDPQLEDGRYGYSQINPMSPARSATLTLRNAPLKVAATVSQYGVDYVEVEANQTVTVAFTGTTQVKLLDTDAYSGQYLWWSNRADESNTTLTRVLDLTNASTAELAFQTWYHIEKDWDYAYVAVGYTDDGRLPDNLDSTLIRWELLDDAGLRCTTTNPNGNNYGCGFTGLSNGWVERTVNLTPYAGKTIVLRFKYITDAAVNQPGFALDDIRLTVNGATVFLDDAETEDTAWIAEGFVRHANVLPQEWLLQTVTFGRDGVAVTSLLPWGATSGSWQLPLSRQTNRVVFVISALAPVTTEIAPYQLIISPTE